MIIFSNVIAQKFSNKGREFWVGYGHNQLFYEQNQQDMILYISADEAANVKVSIHGTSWSRQYNVPANSVVTTELLPKDGGPDDSRLLLEGLSDRGIHIESDVPVVVYTHVYGVNSSGATMLLPVESYGYTYYSLNSEQTSEANCFSWSYIVANEDNTKVTINPVRETSGGKEAGVPFDVVMKRGQIYNIMCPLDFSGTKIQSVPGSDGKCHPIAVFCGSSRTYICAPIILTSGRDFIMQQAFPVSAWGNRYITAVTSSTDGASVLNTNKFRVYVKDPTTLVYRNGVRIPGAPIQRSFYEFSSSSADNITSDKPIMVAQLIPSMQACTTTGEGDPEMIFLSPLEQSINHVTFYSTDKETIHYNFLTLVIPQSGIASLLIDGSNAVDYSYAHPNAPGYQVVVKALPLASMQHTVSSDVNFTAITYGLGVAESYGYNAGTYINNLTVIPAVAPADDQRMVSRICPGTPFDLSVTTIYQPSFINVQLSLTEGIAPAQDVMLLNPVAVSNQVINGKTYYKYDIPGQYTLSTEGQHSIRFSIGSPEIDNCSQSELVDILIPVEKGPVADFTALAVCADETAAFNFVQGDPGTDTWKWTFTDGTTAATQDATFKYTAGGDYKVQLHVERSSDGCTSDTTKTITINSLPLADFSIPDAVCMPAGADSFKDLSSLPGKSKPVFTYNWQFQDGGSSTDKDPEHTYRSAGPFDVTLITTTTDGCKATAVKTVGNFVITPDVHFDIADNTICLNDTALFTDRSQLTDRTKGSWSWSFGDNSTSSIENPARRYTRAGNFIVKLTVTQDGCIGSTENNLKVFDIPYVTAGPDKVSDPLKGIALSGATRDAAVSVEWTPSIYLSDSRIVNPIATPPETRMYYITATGENNCMATDSMVVMIYKEIKVPNAFTPNGDGVNDKWNIPGLSLYDNATVEIFSRWGQRVYSSRGYTRPWDGRINGTELAMGTYYYVIQPNANGYGVIKGTVTLIR